MFSKSLKKFSAKRILVISLSNLGDVVLTFPVLDALKNVLPDSEISVVVGPKAEALLRGNPAFKEIIVFDKRARAREKFRWILALRRRKFDVVVDLRNTAIPFLVGAKYRAALAGRRSSLLSAGQRKSGVSVTPGDKQKSVEHRTLRHLSRLAFLSELLKRPRPLNFERLAKRRKQALYVSAHDKIRIKLLIKDLIRPCPHFVVVAPGAANQDKRWTREGFANVCDRLQEAYPLRVVFVGDKNDAAFVCGIQAAMKGPAVNLCGRTSLPELVALLQTAKLLLANDSAPMHLASYLDTPVVALFGPTDPGIYGPWGSAGYVLRKEAGCPACRQPRSVLRHTCLSGLQSEDVFNLVRQVLALHP